MQDDSCLLRYHFGMWMELRRTNWAMLGLLVLLGSPACSRSVQGSGDGTGGADSHGGSGDGDGDGDGTGGLENLGGMGPGSGGTGTGGAVEPSTVTCGGLEYPEPAVAGDFGCQDFDGVWPPESPWALSETDGSLDIVQIPLVSAPNAVFLDVPPSGAADARLTFQNASGDDLESVLLFFQFNQVPFGAPAIWEDPLKFACVRIGGVEGCLRYQRGDGYSIIVELDNNVGPPTECDYPGGPVSDSWNDISLEMDSTGLVTALIESNNEVTCQGPTATGTVASAWIGMDAPSGSRTEYEVTIDNVTVLAERK